VKTLGSWCGGHSVAGPEARGQVTATTPARHPA
jgi:hypothetical protein